MMASEEYPQYIEVRFCYGNGTFSIVTSLDTTDTTEANPPSLAHFQSARDNPDTINLLELLLERRRNFGITFRRRIGLFLFLMEQLQNIGSGAPKRRATESAIASLKPVPANELPEDERECPICTEKYYLNPVGPCSPYVEDAKDEEFAADMKDEDDRDETPLQMPCGHAFGSTCIMTWLQQSSVCPLCREEVEYIEEPTHPPLMGFDAIEGLQASPNSRQPFPPTLELILAFLSTPQIPLSSPAPDTIAAAAPSEVPYFMQSYASIAHRTQPSQPSIIDRPDLRCAQAAVGLCDGVNDPLLRLECGHAFHGHCLEQSMIIGGYSIDTFERRCPSCRKWYRILQ